MANKTLLNATNEILKRCGIIAGDAGLLTTLTDSARQRWIDTSIQVTNEGIAELYTTCEKPMPNEQAESTLVLVTGTRAYTLATDLVQLRWPFIDKTNSQYLFEFSGGYNAMLIADPEQNDTGLPQYGAIRATDAKLHLDRAPTSVENGRIYTYQYDKALTLTVLTDTVPFNDVVFQAMVPVWAQLWKRDTRQEFDQSLFKMNIGRASRLLAQVQVRSHYNPRA